MKVKIVGKEKITKRETNQSWVNFQCVTDVKCNGQPGSTYGGVRVHQFMLDYDPTYDKIEIGKTYECVTEEQFYRGAIQSRIVGLI